MADRYAARQADRERAYIASFETPEARQWIASLPPEERQRLEAEGLLKPMLDRASSTLREEDAAMLAFAAEEPDFITTMDDDEGNDGHTDEERDDHTTCVNHEGGAPKSSASPSALKHPQPPQAAQLDTTAADVLSTFCARLRGKENPALIFDAICYATGVTALEGVSATELAAHHGITRQAFSKIAVEWCETFGLNPSRGMKSKRARAAYRQRAAAVHAHRKSTHPSP